jgi:glutamate synthase (NADPH/NADH) small chain
MTKRFLGDAEGRVSAVQTVRVDSSPGEGKQSKPLEVPGTGREWPAQMILLAMGFLGAETEGLLTQLGVLINERGNVVVNEDEMTSVPKVFAAGDMTRGQSLVVWAIADGRRAARGVDKYLMGESVLP